MKHCMEFVSLILAVLLCCCAAVEKPSPDMSASPPSAVTAVQSPTPPPDEPVTEPSPETTSAPEPPPETAPAPEPSPEAVELNYQTTTSYDAETGIRRTTLDPQGLDLSVFYEIPVFERTGEGYRKINEFFEELEKPFFTPENNSLTGAWEYRNGIPMPYTFCYENAAAIMTQTDKLVSISIQSFWYMGGVNDTWSESYTFDTETGELLNLTDVAVGTEEEIDAVIRATLRTAEEEMGIEADLVSDYLPNDFEFYVNEGKVYLCFDRYEAAIGAAGSFTVELPVTIDPKFLA